MSTAPARRRARRAPPVLIVYAPSPDDPLDAETASAYLAIHADSQYSLADVPSYKIPGVGVRWRRGDLIAFCYRPEHRRDPAGKCQAKPKRDPGTKPARARRGDRDIVPGTDGETEDELKGKAGW